MSMSWVCSFSLFELAKTEYFCHQRPLEWPIRSYGQATCALRQSWMQASPTSLRSPFHAINGTSRYTFCNGIWRLLVTHIAANFHSTLWAAANILSQSKLFPKEAIFGTYHAAADCPLDIGLSTTTFQSPNLVLEAEDINGRLIGLYTSSDYLMPCPEWFGVHYTPNGM
jgi:hypothetical protein